MRERTQGRRRGKRNAKRDSGTGFWTRELRDGDLSQPMGLSDFYLQLGMHYDLPEKKSTPLAELLRKPRTRWWLVALAVVAVVSSIAGRVAGRPDVVELPPEVWGSWANNDPVYGQRSLSISASEVVIGFSSEAPPVALEVTAVHRRELGDSTAYEVVYRQNQATSRLRFTYLEGAIPGIHLSNPSSVRWFRPIDVSGATPTGQDHAGASGRE